GASWTPEENRASSRAFGKTPGGADILPADKVAKGKAANDLASQEDVRRAALDSIRTLQLIRAYRARGHLMADLDPLGLKEVTYHPELDPAHYGFSREDYSRAIFTGGVLGMEYATLDDI